MKKKLLFAAFVFAGFSACKPTAIDYQAPKNILIEGAPIPSDQPFIIAKIIWTHDTVNDIITRTNTVTGNEQKFCFGHTNSDGSTTYIPCPPA